MKAISIRIKPAGLIAILAAAALIPPLVVAALTLNFARGDRLCRGVTVSDVDIGGLRRAAASDAIQEWARQRSTQQVTLTALDRRWTAALGDLGARIEWRRALDAAFAVGRKGGIVNRAACVLTSGGRGKHIQAEVALDESKLAETLRKVATAVNRPHKDARVKVIDGRLVVEQDSWGIKLDEKSAPAVLARALRRAAVTVALPIKADEPEVTARDAEGIDTLLAQYTTPFNPGTRDRTHNLKLAAEAISGVILKPGQEFSYNSLVGPRETGRGYKSAPIFVHGRLEPGLGGGVCQVSSTLYNAVLLTGLDVVERRPHSRVVPYVPPGRDATVAYGITDFRFRNSNSSPVAVVSKVTRSHLTIGIYGAAADKRDIEIFTSRLRRTGRGRRTVASGSLAPGGSRVLDPGASGVSVVVYRKIKSANGTVVTEVVSRDRYPAQSAVVAVGRSRGSASSGAISPLHAASGAGAAGTGVN